ncbi:MAG: hypothetical protein FWE31_05900 [Firmicutes bacterium]|nr:hypothetical protein [Bacillota bacterium]
MIRRLIFFAFIVACLGFATYVVLFNEFFWYVYGGSSVGGQNGWDILYGFFTNLNDNALTWGTTSAHFLRYALILFCLQVGITLISLALTFVLNFGMLGRSTRLYRNAGTLFSACFVLFGFYLWYAIEYMTDIGGTWSATVFNPWFYVPFGIGILSAVVGSIFRLTEVNR